ncbi:MAG: TRAP transporter large permease [Planctomycetota bacterium]|jgi:C4-dicarboxylate transporter DctM subunit|nr:TRAP transporter large permease [Planctomycetota bacterium]
MASLVLTSFFVMLVMAVPIAHVVLGAAALGVIIGGKNGTIVAQQLFLGCNSFLLLAVPFFIISGDLAAKGKTSEKIVNVVNCFLGRLPGGLGVATVFASALFGAITGSSIACVVAIGALMMPKLLERNYPKVLVLGIITVAGTLGVMIPPSIPMLQQAVAMNLSAGEMFTAGFIPGIVTAAMMSVYVVYYASKHDIPREEEAMSWPERLHTLFGSFWALMFPVIVLGGIYSGLATPTEASVISVFYVLAVELFVYRSFRFRDMYNVMRQSTVSAATLTITVATAQVFVWYMTTAKLPDLIYGGITTYISSTWLLWVLLCVMFLIVGCFTNVTTVVVILGPLLVSVLNHYQIDLIHFGIIAIMLAQIGFVTPPFGLCLFTTMKIGPATMPEVVKGSWPFLGIMILATVLFILFPQLSLWLPNLVFRSH